MDISSDDILRLIIYILPFGVAIILHEVAHGYVALRLGDPTAKAAGRLTLNPIKHIDPAGLMVFVMTSLLTNFVFGWAKPVPVNTRYFKNPRQGMMLTSLAGPMTNFALAVAFAVLFGISYAFVSGQETGGMVEYLGVPFVTICQAGILVNLVLGTLNLIPIPPLDGSKVLQYFMPQEMAIKYLNFERYGFIILIMLIMFGVIGSIIRFFAFPVYSFLLGAVT